MAETVGWAGVCDHTVLSQQSIDSISDHADALRDTTASEPESQDAVRFQDEQAWWAKAVQAALRGNRVRAPTQLRTLVLVSGCTGCFAEGRALKD